MSPKTKIRQARARSEKRRNRRRHLHQRQAGLMPVRRRRSVLGPPADELGARCRLCGIFAIGLVLTLSGLG